jgi:urease accessory protein
VTALARVRLLQLASQALPIGGFSHSHGLEAAIESGCVRDEATLASWVLDLLKYSIGSYEAPLLLDLYAAWAADDAARIDELNAQSLATRETAELRAATVQMGYSLRMLLGQLPDFPRDLHRALAAIGEPSLPCVWSAAAMAWNVPAEDALAAYLWAWAENQVLAAVKAVPLGQSAGQRVLAAAGAAIAGITKRPPGAQASDARPRSNFAPAFAILSSQHETQYSRLFRS